MVLNTAFCPAKGVPAGSFVPSLDEYCDWMNPHSCVVGTACGGFVPWSINQFAACAASALAGREAHAGLRQGVNAILVGVVSE